jgi:hypothetical protein
MGDWRDARVTLDTHNAVISPLDRGLALALAGDPVGGAQLLTEVVRSGQATPKARQNLALALALAGQWQGARVVASADMSPADVDQRMEQWAAFARPRASADQVSTLLGIRAVEDPGQPVALALAAAVAAGAPVSDSPAAEAAVVTPVIAPVEPDAVAPATPTDIALVKQAMALIPQARPAVPPMLKAQPRAYKVALARPAGPPKGQWYVQVGAYRNPAVAENGWKQVTRRMPALARNVPVTARFAAKGGDFYRLAFGGLGRSEAESVCRRYKASGGACFVRAAAGDQVASWAAPKTIQLASR